MMTSSPHPPSQTRLLILRIWQPHSSQLGQRYIRLQDTHSGDVIYFKDWQALLHYLQDLEPFLSDAFSKGKKSIHTLENLSQHKNF